MVDLEIPQHPAVLRSGHKGQWLTVQMMQKMNMFDPQIQLESAQIEEMLPEMECPNVLCVKIEIRACTRLLHQSLPLQRRQRQSGCIGEYVGDWAHVFRYSMHGLLSSRF